MSDFLYQYPTLYPGILLKRYKRFFADIELATGEQITAHCPNTGPMTCISTPGSPVLVSRSDNPNRKLAYTWEMIQVTENEPTWVGVNTAMPNRVIRLALEQHLIPEVGEYDQVRFEVPYGQDRGSRIDFLLTRTASETAKTESTDKPTYVEVKSTTWAKGRLAMFPDTVTTRGQKHLRELMALRPDANAVMLYFINRSDCLSFAPGERTDPTYARLWREAIALGVQVLPCRFEITPAGIRYLGLAAIDPESL